LTGAKNTRNENEPLCRNLQAVRKLFPGLFKNASDYKNSQDYSPQNQNINRVIPKFRGLTIDFDILGDLGNSRVVKHQCDD